MPKTSRPEIQIINAETGDVTLREMNDAEFLQYEADKAASLLAQAEAETKANARQAILDRLGITAEEAVLLLG
jgi:hypothetical protein